MRFVRRQGDKMKKRMMMVWIARCPYHYPPAEAMEAIEALMEALMEAMEAMEAI